MSSVDFLNVYIRQKVFDISLSFGVAGVLFMWGQGAAASHTVPLRLSFFNLKTFANYTLLVLFFQCSPAAKLRSFVPSNILGARPMLFIQGCGFSFSLQRAAQGSRQHTETSSLDPLVILHSELFPGWQY